MVRPTEKGFMNIKEKIGKIIKKAVGMSEIIMELNPIIRG